MSWPHLLSLAQRGERGNLVSKLFERTFRCALWTWRSWDRLDQRTTEHGALLLAGARAPVYPTSIHQPYLPGDHRGFRSSHSLAQNCRSNRDLSHWSSSCHVERSSRRDHWLSYCPLDCSNARQMLSWGPRSWSSSYPQSRDQTLPERGGRSSSVGLDQALLTQVRVVAIVAHLRMSASASDLVSTSRPSRPRTSSLLKTLAKANSLSATYPSRIFLYSSHQKNLLGALK